MANVVKSGEWTAPTEKERKTLPQSYFLGADKSFPYKVWKGPNKGAISCPALRAVISRANTSGHRAIGLKGSALYQKYCKGKE